MLFGKQTLISRIKHDDDMYTQKTLFDSSLDMLILNVSNKID